jgi:hypothetical protein
MFILFQAAWAHNRETAKDKWKKFTEQVELDGLSEQQIKVMLHTLDDKRQWAPIHYAVDANNLYVFQKLTEGEKRFRCSKYFSFSSHSVMYKREYILFRDVEHSGTSSAPGINDH